MSLIEEERPKMYVKISSQDEFCQSTEAAVYLVFEMVQKD